MINKIHRNKKTGHEATRKKKTHQRIASYLDNQIKASQNYCQTFQEYLCSNDIELFFNQLHQYLEKGMILQAKKNIFLDDGVYILLEGNITYVWTKNKHDRDRKDHLFSLAKVGVFSNLSLNTNCIERQNTLSNGYSLTINNPFAVIQCEIGNICTNQDSILLKIPEEVLQKTNFYKLKQERVDLFSKIKVPGGKNFPQESLIDFNINLHHTLKLRKYYFRNKFNIQSLGIIVEGSSTVKSLKGHKKMQFSKHSLLIANLEYQVSSAQIQIIEIVKNPTIIFRMPKIMQKIIEEMNVRISLENEDQKNELMNKYRKKISNSISISKIKPDKFDNNIENKKKRKQFSLFSKQCQNYCIVSMQLCQQNLHRIKKINKQVLKTEKRNKKPHILFNFSKKQGRSTRASKENIDQNNLSNIETKNQSLSCHKENLMERYSIYAKDMYEEYKKRIKQAKLQNVSNRKQIDKNS